MAIPCWPFGEGLLIIKVQLLKVNVAPFCLLGSCGRTPWCLAPRMLRLHVSRSCSHGRWTLQEASHWPWPKCGHCTTKTPGPSDQCSPLRPCMYWFHIILFRRVKSDWHEEMVRQSFLRVHVQYCLNHVPHRLVASGRVCHLLASLTRSDFAAELYSEQASGLTVQGIGQY